MEEAEVGKYLFIIAKTSLQAKERMNLDWIKRFMHINWFILVNKGSE